MAVSSKLTAQQQHQLAALLSQTPAGELGELFAAAGAEFALVGGPVRDMLLARPTADLDFTTSARPDQIEAILRPWGDAVWDVGRDYGTIGARRGDWICEVTTYRADDYTPDSRKPDVTFGDTIDGDLSRRDFTVNAMAVRLPQIEFVDPFDGLAGLQRGELVTPVTAEQSFSDDPLRMIRAARFAAQLQFSVAPDVVEAMAAMADRISIVSAERIRTELVKLICAPWPRAGLDVLVSTGLAQQFLPELPALQLERDEHFRHKDVYEHSLTVLEQAIELEPRLTADDIAVPDIIVRFAALMHDVGKPRTRRLEGRGRSQKVTFHHHDVVGAKMTRKRMNALRFSKDETEQVSRLVELHLRFHGYGDGDWTDAAVRRYVRDAGDQLARLHVLTRADCTTRNQRKATRLRQAYDHLEERIATLAEQEELDAIRPDLGGNEIMAILGIGPGPEVGQAYRFLLDLRMEQGPMGKQAATAALHAWWAARD